MDDSSSLPTPLPEGEGRKVELTIEEHQSSDGYRWKYRHYEPVGAARGTTFRYTEILTNPAYGAAQVLTAPTPRPTGVAWTDSVSVNPSGAIPEGRELVSVADLVDHELEAEEQARPLAVFAGVPYRPVVIATVVVPVDH